MSGASVLTSDIRFGDFLKSLLREGGFEIVSPKDASLLAVDLDTSAVPKGFTGEVLTLSVDIFTFCDLYRPFLKKDFLMLCRQKIKAQPTVADKAAKRHDAADQQEVPLSLPFVWENGKLRCFGETVSLTPAEARLFQLLYTHRGACVGQADCEAVCRVREGQGNSVAVVLAGLRRKIDHRFGIRLFRTYRGAGYGMID